MIHTEALLVFGTHHPDLFWQYLLAVSLPARRGSCQVYDTQREFFNVPSQEMTISQARDSLTDLALGVLDKSGKLGSGPRSQAYGEFRDRLEVKVGQDGAINGGNEALNLMKHASKVDAMNALMVQSRSVDRTGFTLR
jgi:hypothetical protein